MVQQLECDEPDNLLYIGIDIHSGLTKEQMQVSIRAIDEQENKQWITGIGLSFNGSLTRQEQNALQNSHPDEYLRGLRSLPFESDQIISHTT